MSRYLLEVDDDLWRKVKIAAALKSVPIKTFITDLLQQTLSGPAGRANRLLKRAVNIEGK